MKELETKMFRIECNRSKDGRAFELVYQRDDGLHVVAHIPEDADDATVAARLRQLAMQISADPVSAN